jgi:catechol 2,3-dioxygenase-like lactoylglutathione lyase family enzyme
MLFRDLDDARKVYERALGGTQIHEEETPGRKRSVFYAVGEDTVIEAAQPLSPTSPEGLDMERAGEGIYSVTFKTKDVKRAAQYLRSKRQRVAEDAGSLVIDRDDAFGMVIGFTEGKIPNDPR